jgi:DNA repair exonuclease SbcCD ATPase subunit
MSHSFDLDDTTRLDVDRLLAAMMEDGDSAPSKRETSEIKKADHRAAKLELFEALSERQKRFQSEEHRLAEQNARIQLERALHEEMARRLALEDRLSVEQAAALAMERRIEELEALLHRTKEKAHQYAKRAQAEYAYRKQLEARLREVEEQLAAFMQMFNGDDAQPM